MPVVEVPKLEEPIQTEPPLKLPDLEPVRSELPVESNFGLPVMKEPMKAEPVAAPPLIEEPVPPKVEPVSTAPTGSGPKLPMAAPVGQSELTGPFPEPESLEHSFRTGPLPELPPFGIPNKSRSLPDPVAAESGPILPQVTKAQSLSGILPTKEPAANFSSEVDEGPPRGELHSPLEPSSAKQVQQTMGYALSSPHDRVVEPQKSMAEQFSPPPGKLQKAARERSDQTANPAAAQSARIENREGSLTEPLEVKRPKRVEIQAEPIRMETSSKVQQEVVREFGQSGRAPKPGETQDASKTTFVSTPSVTPTSSPKLEAAGKETHTPPAMFRNRSEAQVSEAKSSQADPRSQADDGQTLFERKTVAERKDDGSEIFLLNRRKTDPKPNVEESVVFRKQALENNQVPPPVTVWSKANNNALESDNWGELNKEQKIVKRTLLDLTRSAIKIGSVKMTHDTSKVYAEVVDLDVKDWAQVGYLKQEFKEKTGRELIITNTSKRETKRPEFEPERDPFLPRPRPVTPKFLPYQSEPEIESEEEKKKKKESAIEHMTAKVDSVENSRESRIYRRSRPATEASGLEIPPAPTKKQDSGPEKDESDISVRKLRGRAARPKTTGGGGGTPKSKGGGPAARQRRKSFLGSAPTVKRKSWVASTGKSWTPKPA